MHNHLIINIVVIKNSSSVSEHSMLCISLDRKSLHNPLGCIQLTYIKSIDMLNKNTLGIKKARPSQKHQLALIHTSD